MSAEGFKISEKDVPFAGSFDSVICGGGPAGIGAAVASSKGGAKTLLLESLNSVGGVGTGTKIYSWCDSPGGRVFDELEERVIALGKGKRSFDPARHIYKKGRVVLHGETVKAVALQMIRKAGAHVFFGATAVGSVLRDGKVRGIIFATRDGLRFAETKALVDATADAGVSVSAGAKVAKGDIEDGRLMHVCFMFDVDGVDLREYERRKLPEDVLVEIIKDAHRKGEINVPEGAFLPGPEFFPYDMPGKRLVLGRWEIEKVDCSDPAQVSKTIAQGQAAALDVVNFCRKNLPGYENCGIGRFYGMLGARESRRIKGLYTLTRDDVVSGRKFPDGIARACFFIDFHDSPPGRTVPYTLEFKSKNSPPPGDFYEIPYRCLISDGVTGLIAAGRCISADRSALASLRIMPTCMYIGEAAGYAAAFSALEGVPPHEIDAGKIRSVMGFETSCE